MRCGIPIMPIDPYAQFVSRKRSDTIDVDSRDTISRMHRNSCNIFLSCVHEDLNRIVMRPILELKDSNRRSDSVVASESWQNHLRRDLSIISTLFFGQFKSLLICKQCGHESATFNPFSILPVPLPERGARNRARSVRISIVSHVHCHSLTSVRARVRISIVSHFHVSITSLHSTPITRTFNTEQVRLHYADGRMPVDVAVSLSVSEMKRFTVGTLLSKISQLFPSTSSEQRAVVEYSNSGTFINSVLNDSSLRLRTNDLARPIDVWCFQGFNEKKDEEEKESS